VFLRLFNSTFFYISLPFINFLITKKIEPLFFILDSNDRLKRLIKMKKARILLVDDDKVSSKVLKKYLDIRGFEVVCANGSLQALELFNESKFDLCILDIMMPAKDGFELAQEIREIDEMIPLLFLTSRSMTEDKIKAFKIGADDYITKPFNSEELMLRVTAIIKRNANTSKPENSKVINEEMPSKIRIGLYLLDVPFQRLKIGDSERKLTSRETELLCFLIKSKNNLVRRELILQEIWGDDDYYKGRSLDVFMSRLRKYLKDDPNIEIINVHAHGFKLILQEKAAFAINEVVS
jgi:DNA-binding response OmpR family regulator